MGPREGPLGYNRYQQRVSALLQANVMVGNALQGTAAGPGGCSLLEGLARCRYLRMVMRWATAMTSTAVARTARTRRSMGTLPSSREDSEGTACWYGQSTRFRTGVPS